jgi:glycogen phosphorylase
MTLAKAPKTAATRITSTGAATQSGAQAAINLASAVNRHLDNRRDPAELVSQLFAVQSGVRELLEQRWAKSQATSAKDLSTRRINYLSMEFLMGRTVGNALLALETTQSGETDQPLTKALNQQMLKSGYSLDQVLNHEPDAALGNGGLGRLAACFLDSFATLEMPSFGYGLRYQHGMFRQQIEDGKQIELPETWLTHGNPLEVERVDTEYVIGFGGRVTMTGNRREWQPASFVAARAYDMIVPGRATQAVSTLRLWKALPAAPIDFVQFSRGDIQAAAPEQLKTDALCWVLYPDDSTEAGRELRLRQEFLLVSASLQDMIAAHLAKHGDLNSFGRHNVVHLNDTHPGLAPAELMRLLMDVHGFEWNEARRITQEAVSYTCHTLMPEALESWPIALMERLLPRHMEIMYEINQRFLNRVAEQFPGNNELLKRVSLIDESGERRVRMAALAVVSSNRVNGVSALHSQLMIETIFADYALIWPERFTNVTNGVTLTRWLMHANPALSAVLDKELKPSWRNEHHRLQELAALAGKATVQKRVMAAKRLNKERLAALVQQELGMTISPDSLFDVHTKRIHEYKRQLLNVFHVVSRYQAILANPHADWTPRTIFFAGKAASAYAAAKNIIRLIHDVAKVINGDARVNHLLKVVYLSNYGVSLAQTIIPAADLSEQISTAGTEASGTGNMKFALNGALTIGTWDGANIEMAQAMGADNMFVFGLSTAQVAQVKQLGYDPRVYYEGNRQIQAVVDAISGGVFCASDPDRYRAMMQQLLRHDPYLVLADFSSYSETQLQVDELYKQPAQWAKRVLLNVSAMGQFSIDRATKEYLRDIWSWNPAR